MRFRVILSATLAAGVMCLASASNAHAFELLDRVLNVGSYGHGHGCGCEASCGCDAGPSCCAPEPTCCAPEPSCCKPKCRKHRCHRGLFSGGLFGHHGCGCGHDHGCGCEPVCAAEPTCCAPEPSCCKPKCRKHRCHRGMFSGGLFGHHGCGCGHDRGCGCEPVCGCGH